MVDTKDHADRQHLLLFSWVLASSQHELRTGYHVTNHSRKIPREGEVVESLTPWHWSDVRNLLRTPVKAKHPVSCDCREDKRTI